MPHLRVHILNLWDNVRGSYWFVPGLMCAFAVCMSIALPWVEGMFASTYPPTWSQSTMDSSRATLSAITAAMITVSGTVFSITMVTLSLTSQQYGPRLLRTFMQDLPTQLTLGVFVSTGLYSLLVLHDIEDHPTGHNVPHLSVLLALVFMVLSIAMLIFYIHHVSLLIQAPRIVEAVSHDLNAAIVHLFPEGIGEESITLDELDAAAWEDRDMSAHGGFAVAATKEGYIQALDVQELLDIATRDDMVIRFYYRPGDFLIEGMLLADVSKPCDRDGFAAQVNQGLIVGMRRTPRQDLECAVNELVEVAVRSLSPGINDPFTAMNCVDRLGAALRRLAQKQMPSRFRRDAQGQLRLIMKATSFPPVLDASFNQIRQYSANSVAVTIRLLEVLCNIAEVVTFDADRQAVRCHAEMIHSLTRGFPEVRDRDDATRVYKQVIEQLDARRT